jgi:hypothetical protein
MYIDLYFITYVFFLGIRATPIFFHLRRGLVPIDLTGLLPIMSLSRKKKVLLKNKKKKIINNIDSYDHQNYPHVPKYSLLVE